MKGVFAVVFECEVRDKISSKTGNPYQVLAVKVVENPPSWLELFIDSNQSALIAIGAQLQK